ncbi:MAG TPA: hypothetical protein VJ385_18805 [Fibrobacteria bacterium]|nr:hypothetical protein [Fibrobacteria bacterium]
MENRNFRLPDHSVEARLERLGAAQARALERALESLSGDRPGRPGDREGWPVFLLPLAEFGLSAAQILRLAEKVPEGFPLDHRDIYFDFRLDRWVRHIEPPTISESLEEYLDSAPTPAEGLAYLRERWLEFLRRHGAG